MAATAFSADEPAFAKASAGKRRYTPMKRDAERAELDRLTERVIGCAFEVTNTLGSGFLEKVYENALAVELRRQSIRVEQQKLIEVRYRSELVGEGVLDLLVEDVVIVEVKAMDALDGAHTAQCLNYLKATEHPVCLLFNFGRPRVQMKRFVRDF